MTSRDFVYWLQGYQIEAAIEQLKARGEHMYAAHLKHALEYAKECLTQPTQSNKS